MALLPFRYVMNVVPALSNVDPTLEERKNTGAAWQTHPIDFPLSGRVLGGF